jgi:very-short-patch-repair endonuclease
MVIEVDGGQHADSVRDRDRDAWLEAEGFRILRFWNNDVLKNTDAVLWQIRMELNRSLPLSRRAARATLSPEGRGDTEF